MHLSAENKKLIVDEIDFVTKKMNEEDDPSKKLYYFSAIPGMVQRVYNIEYDNELVYAHFILQASFDVMNQRIQALRQKGDGNVVLYPEQFAKLEQLSNEYGKRLKENKPVDSVLKKFVVLLTSTTGNGYYLMQKGLLKI